MAKVDLNEMANTREQFLFIAVFLVFALIFFRVFYVAQMKKMDENQRRIQALTLERDALIKFSSSTPSLQKGETLSQKKGIKIRILSGDVKAVYEDITGLMAKISEPSFMEGVSLQKLTLGPQLADKGFNKTDLTVDVLSDFPDLIKYMERLEQFPALFNVENIQLKSIEGRSHDLEAGLSMRFFNVGLDGAPVAAPAKQVSQATTSAGGAP